MDNSLLPNFSTQAIAEENARFMSKVYSWMTLGILLTALISYFIGNNQELAVRIVQNKVLFYGLLFAEFGMVLAFSFLLPKINSLTALALFMTYSALNGVTFSIIFLIFTQDSIASIFVLTAFSFAGLGAVGYFTKKDLGPIGTFCTMGLFGLVGFGLLSLFFSSLWTETTSKVYAIVGVIVFAGLTAYDTQKIKQMNIIGNEGTDENQKEAISGALTLYLDFINLFLSLLRLFGRRR